MIYSPLLCVLLLTGPLAAQTTPAPNPPATPAPNSSVNGSLANQSLLADSTGRRPVGEGPPLRLVRRAPSGHPPAAPTSNDYQGPLYVPLDPNTYRLLDRYVIRYGPDSTQDPHTSVRPYSRAAAAHLGERMLRGALSRTDRFNAEYLVQDNWLFSPTGDSLNQSRRPFLHAFYRRQTDFYAVRSGGFAFRISPVVSLQAGVDRGNGALPGLRYVNTRGLAFEGRLAQRLGFYGTWTDNQIGVPGWVQNRVVRDTIVPHEGYWKYHKTYGGNAYDFFNVRGGLTYAATRHISLLLAHDRNFIGNGYRSLILSDYSSPYFFFKLNVRVWQLNYQTVFAQLTAGGKNAGQPSPKKYLAMHHLSLDIGPGFNVGLFESIVQGGPNRGVELQYLNPVIFYKAIEQQIGSADKALLGADFRWNIAHRGQVYGQLIINEFRLQDILQGTGWYGNKQGVQLGAKLLDLGGVRNLDLQVEVNYVRPYTYQAAAPYALYRDYTNYQQPLAHPLGANFTEVLAILSYQPAPRLSLVGKAFYWVQGLDQLAPDGSIINQGGNPLFPYSTAPQLYGNRTGQGNNTHLLHLDATATYQPRLNFFLDASIMIRHQTYAQTPVLNGTEVYPSLALRWNIAQRLHEF